MGDVSPSGPLHDCVDCVFANTVFRGKAKGAFSLGNTRKNLDHLRFIEFGATAS